MNIHPIVTFLLLNLFWAFFLLPGLAAYTFIAQRNPRSNKDYWVKRLVYSFFFSIILFSPLSIAAYFATIPSLVGSLYFSVLVVSSAIFLGRQIANNSLGSIVSNIPWKSLKNPWVILLISVVVGDIILSTLARGFIVLGSDAWTHIAQINFMSHHGFSVFDPYLLENGKQIVQSTHPANLTNTILALPVNLLRINALDTWMFSTAFFRLAGFATVFVFARDLTKNKQLALLIVSIFFLSQLQDESLLTILYPANQAFFFSIFLLLVSLRFINKGSSLPRLWYVIYLATIPAISLIHPVQWSLTALFLGGLLGLYWITKQITFKRALQLGWPLVLGLPPALFSLWAAKYIPSEVKTMGDDFFKFGKGLIAFNYLVKTYTVAIIGISLAGLWATAQYVRSNAARSLLYYSMIFNVVLFYSPFFTIVHILLPAWAIARYSYLHTLFIACLAGFIVYFILGLAVRQEKQSNLRPLLIISMLSLAVMPFHSNSARIYYWGQNNRIDYRTVDSFASFNQKIPAGSVVLAEGHISFFEPALCDCRVVAIDHTRSTNAIDTRPRELEVKGFYASKNPVSDQQRQETLDRYNVTHLFLRKDLVDLVQPHKHGLERIDENQKYYLYRR